MVPPKICFGFGCGRAGPFSYVFRVLQGAEHQGLRPPLVLSRNLGYYDTQYHVLVSGMGAGCTIAVHVGVVSKREQTRTPAERKQKIHMQPFLFFFFSLHVATRRAICWTAPFPWRRG